MYLYTDIHYISDGWENKSKNPVGIYSLKRYLINSFFNVIQITRRWWDLSVFFNMFTFVKNFQFKTGVVGVGGDGDEGAEEEKMKLI